MKNNPIPYAEYQKRMKELKTPEEIAAFAQELIAPMLANVASRDQVESPEEEVEMPPVIKEPKPIAHAPKPKAYSRRNPYATEAVSPWYDVVGSDTEAMVIDLYAKGLTTRDIVNYLKRNHGIEMSQPSVSGITDKVFPLVKEWQTRALSSCYPIVYLDGMHFKVRETGKIASKVAYIALGINQFGYKEVLGIESGGGLRKSLQDD